MRGLLATNIFRKHRMKVTFLDVEYANIQNKSIAQIGILSKTVGKNDPNAVEINLLIDPEDEFNENCVRIHGITADKVKSAPNFKVIWDDIEKYFTNAVVIGHNIASSALDAITKNLERYNIEPPEMYYLCTYELAKKIIPSFAISDYGLYTLCNFFGIPFKRQHDAFYDACVCSDILDRLVNESGMNIEDEVQRYIPNTMADLMTYITNAALKKDIHSFYGAVSGFALDSRINEQEFEYIKNWRETFSAHGSNREIAEIIGILDKILEDGIISPKEVMLLQANIRKHLDIVSSSMVTLTTQILNGILKGMIVDDVITEDECLGLQKWLYEHNYLSGHYPFDRIFEVVEDVLEDGVLTKEEAILLKTEIDLMLNPLDALKKDIQSLQGKHICLSGNFAFGNKSAVEKYIIDRGGFIDRTVEKTTDILVLGESEKKLTERTKVRQALELNENGGDITISKEIDIIEPTKTFRDLLLEHIDKSGLSDAEVYKKAQLPRQIMSKIKCSQNYLPSKQNICAFAIALCLTMNETNDLLAAAGYILTSNFDFDRIIVEAISSKNYDISDINIKLYEIGISWLGTK